MAKFSQSWLRNTVSRKITAQLEVTAKRLSEIAREAAAKEQAKMLKWLADQLGGNLEGPPSILQTSWASLSRSYARRKAKRGASPAFFSYSGDLRTALGRAAGKEADIFGVTTVKARTLKDKTIRITVRPFPVLQTGVTNSDLSSMLSAALPGADPRKTFGKLTNSGAPGGPERPLLLPTLQYFAKSRITRAVMAAIKESIRGANTQWKVTHRG